MCLGETVTKEKRQGSLEPWMNHPFPLPFPPSHSLLSWWLTAGTRGNPGGGIVRSWDRPQQQNCSSCSCAAVGDGAGSGSGEGYDNHTGCSEDQTRGLLAHVQTFATETQCWPWVRVNRHWLPFFKSMHWRSFALQSSVTFTSVHRKWFIFSFINLQRKAISSTNNSVLFSVQVKWFCIFLYLCCIAKIRVANHYFCNWSKILNLWFALCFNCKYLS